ncbi:MAG: hypothetical protein V3T55_08870 [Anaerolineales bacterium]
MGSCTPRKYWLIIFFVFILSACNFNVGSSNSDGSNANEPPGGGPKPSQVKVIVLASQVIDDESVNVRGDAQLELDLTPPEGATTSTFAVQATGDGTKQLSIAATDKGQICWVTVSFMTIVQLNGSVDAQTLALEFTLTETYEGKPTQTNDCSWGPPIDGALLFTPFHEGPYRISLENPVFKQSFGPNSWTEVRLEVGGD